MNTFVFELFKIGVGPSSSHTTGPMIIAKEFLKIAEKKNVLIKSHRIKIELFGSLGATGKGHSSDKAIVFGLLGYTAETIDMQEAHREFEDILTNKTINLFKIKTIDFNFQKDLILHQNHFLDFHSNAIKLYMYDENDDVLLYKTYYSIGGGTILDEDDILNKKNTANDFPYNFNTANELLNLCKKHNLSISALMMENEKSLRSVKEIEQKLLYIWEVMQESVKRGCSQTGFLPIMKVRRRANESYNLLQKKAGLSIVDPLEVMDWLSLWALAVNEENACGGRVVTAPTNGAAGIVPSVMHYMNKFLGNCVREFDEQQIINFLLTAGAIGLLYQKNASISGADVGCQGEVGVACSMAAGALAEAMGGSIEQVENAAEIGMEHNLGLTCDPIGGLVQIPCIERNAMASVTAVNAARMALGGDGKHYVSLDSVIKTMFETGKDMMNKYKETSTGGLAVNVTEC